MDLHIHTNLSDGVKSPIEILDMAENLKLEYISITDHDTCEAYEILDKIDISKHYTGNLIYGCEILTCFEGILLEILAYGIDWKQLNTWLKEYYSEEQIKIRETKMFNTVKQTILNNSIIQISENLNLPDKIPYTGYFKFMLYNDILKFEKNKKFLKEFDIQTYENFLRKGLYTPASPVYLNQGDFLINAKEVVELIHQFGGLAFVAHTYKISVNDHITFLQRMLDTEVKLDGIEVNYSSFTKQQEEELINFCKKNNLLMSGGSDYHGISGRNEQIGFGTEGHRISKKYIEEWYRKINKGENYETNKI